MISKMTLGNITFFWGGGLVGGNLHISSAIMQNMYIMTISNSCFSPNLTTHDRLTGVFSPQLNSGLCRYEVVYTNTSSVGRNTLCFKLW